MSDVFGSLANAFAGLSGFGQSLTGQQQQMAFNNGYHTASNLTVSNWNVAYPPPVVTEQPAKAVHPDLAWLDRRVDEMRVAL